MSEKKYEFRNEFVIACIISIVIVLVMCYFTFSSSFLSSSVIKGTSAAESCTCAADEEPITGNLCKKEFNSDQGSPWTCEAMTGGLYSCTKPASCATVPEDDEYACFYHGEEQVWRKYGDYKDNSEYQYISNVEREDCADTGNVCGVDKKYGTWDETTCKDAGHTWDSSNSCCVCGEGYYVNSSSVCTKCESGYYCTGDRKRVQCASGKGSPEGSTKESDCTSTKVTITYKSDGGSGTMSNTECEKGKSCTIRTNSFTKSGYTFDGWNGSDDKTYSDGESITISGDLTLTAKWKKNSSGSSDTVTITYKAGGGSGSMSNTECEKNKSCTISTNSFAKSGYTFDGWSGSNNKSYSDGESITISSDLTLTAKWKANSSSSPSSDIPSSSNPSSSTNTNTNENPQTGEIAIFGMWVIAFGAICYSFWYFKKLNES